MHHNYPSVFGAILLAATASAQVTFDPNIGTGLGLRNDAISAPRTLGFTFDFIGTAVTQITVDSNGRIFPAGANGSDFSESIAELINRPFPSICLYWDDLDPDGAGADDVYFNAYHNGSQNVAVITWNRMQLFGRTGPNFDMQIKLFDDSRWSLYWGPNTPAHDCLVGCAAGSGAFNPGQWDIDDCATIVTSGVAAMYELFDNYASQFDLAGSGIEFVPDGLGGWVVTTPYSPGTCARPVPPAAAAKLGVGCGGFTAPPVAVDYIPDGANGYVITSSARVFDSNLGTSIGIASDDATASAALGFNFVMPGGGSVSTLTVDANGRLSPSAIASDGTPTEVEFLSVAGGCLAPCWGDFDVTDSDSTGTIMFRTNGVNYATVTWNGVAQFGGTAPLTWQIQIFGSAHPTAPNGWTVVYQDMGLLEVVPFGPGNWMVGCTAGAGAANPGESNLGTLPLITFGNPTVFETFDRLVPDVWDLTQRGLGALDLNFSTLPIIGTNFDLQLDNIPPGASLVVLMIGFNNLNIDMSIIGVPCWLYSGNQLPAAPMVWTPGQEFATLSLPITSLNGQPLPLVLQGAIINFGANPLNVETSNAVRGVTGS